MSSSETPFRLDPFAQPFAPTKSNPTPNSPTKPSRGRSLVLFCLLSIATFGGSMLFLAPSLLSMRRLASARDSLAERRDEEALRVYDKVIESNPTDEQFRIERLQLLSRLGEKEKAKTDLKVIEDFFSSQKQPLSPWQLEARSQIRQMGGAFRNALADQSAVLSLKIAEKPTPSEEAQYLNNHAYSAGLAVEQEPTTQTADQELLKKVLADCDRSLKLSPEQSSTFDTRGYIHYLLGDTEKAIADLDRSLELVLINLQQVKSQANGDRRQLNPKLALRTTEYGVSVIYQHRMRAHQKAGHEESAQKDRQAIIELGCKPDILLQ